MSERWAVDMVEALRGLGGSGGSGSGGNDGGLMFAKVNTAKPLTLLAYDQVISKGLYLNPALLVDADDQVDRIKQEFQGLSSAPFPFLQEFHQKFVLKKDDEVVVLKVGAAFYILAKAVAL